MQYAIKPVLMEVNALSDFTVVISRMLCKFPGSGM